MSKILSQTPMPAMVTPDRVHAGTVVAETARTEIAVPAGVPEPPDALTHPAAPYTRSDTLLRILRHRTNVTLEALHSLMCQFPQEPGWEGLLLQAVDTVPWKQGERMRALAYLHERLLNHDETRDTQPMEWTSLRLAQGPVPDPQRWNELLSLCGPPSDASFTSALTEGERHARYAPGGSELLRYIAGDGTDGRRFCSIEDYPREAQRPVGLRARRALSLALGGLSMDVADRLLHLPRARILSLRAGLPPLTTAVPTPREPSLVFKDVDLAGNADAQGRPAVERSPVLRGDFERAELVVVGHGGEAWASALMDAARIGSHVVRTEFADSCGRITRHYEDLLALWTFRGRADESLGDALMSDAQALALLTYHPVRSLTLPEMLTAVTRGHLMDAVAKGPIGVLGPLTAHGLVPTETLRVDAAGRGHLAPAFEHLIRETRLLREGRSTTAAPHTNAGCPFAVQGIPRLRSDGTTEAIPGTVVAELHRAYERVLRELAAV